MNFVDVISRRVGAVAAVLVVGASATSAVAQEDRAPDVDNLEVTMRLLPEGATRPDAVTRVIELPEALRSRLADEAIGGTSDADDPQRGAAADLAGRSGDALPRRDDAVSPDFNEVARTAIERARELGQGNAAASPAAAAPSGDGAAGGRDAVAAAAAEPRDAPPAQSDAAPGARDAAAGARDAAGGARDAAGARDTAGSARGDLADTARGRARDAAAEVRESERELADRARDAREDAARGRMDRPARAEPDRPDVPERPEPGRGRPERP